MRLLENGETGPAHKLALIFRPGSIRGYPGAVFAAGARLLAIEPARSYLVATMMRRTQTCQVEIK